MNQQSSEQILDSLLEEMLTQQHPPDLTARIVNAWKVEQSQSAIAVAPSKRCEPSGSSAVRVSSVACSVSSVGETVLRNPPVPPPPPAKESSTAVLAPVSAPVSAVVVGVELAKKQSQASQHGRTRVAWGLATVAAALLVFLGWKAGQISVPEPQFAEVPVAPSPGTVERNLAEAPHKSSAVHETLALDDLPFADSNAVANPATTAGNEIVSVTETLDAPAVVAELDRRLNTMWTSLEVVPGAAYAPPELAQQLSITLTGQGLPASATSDGLEKDALLADALDSRVFALHWSKKFLAEWLGNGLQRPGVGDEALLGLTQVVAARIENGGKWNEVILDLLGGSLEDSKSSESLFVAALAGGENHRLIERIGTSFLDANLACIRCHDANARPKQDIEKQQTYWSLVAMLKGLDTRTNDSGGRDVVDRQAELIASRSESKVFFDLPNGALKSAEANLPDGSNWSELNASPRKALATWISQSPELDRATVNIVWKQIFGRPLVPYVAETDSVAYADRTELLDFLANQFRAHEHDLKSLVAWVVSSDAFARMPLNLEKSQWLEATDEELQNYQLQELVFAAGPSLGRSGEARSLESSLLAVAEWDGPGAANTTLAQPAIEGSNRPPRLPSSVQMPSMSFVLHGQQPTISQQQFVKSLLRAKRLSWEQRVDHVVGLSGHFAASGRVQQLARQLLEENSGNASAALLQLLWAVQNSDAS